MRSRRLILGIVSWLVVVALSSTVVWAVISRAGDTLVSTDEPVIVTQTEDGDPTSRGTPRTTELSATPTVATPPPETQPPAPTVTSASTASGTPSSTPAPSSPSPAPSSSTASPDTSTEPTREPRNRTWQGTGGRLVVACDGSRISLVAAQPDAGFKVEVGHEGSVRIEAEFEGREDRDGEGSHVRAECVAGIPDFVVETRGEGNHE